MQQLKTKYADYLGVPITDIQNFSKLRSAYRKKMIKQNHLRQNRINLNLAYDYFCKIIFKIQEEPNKQKLREYVFRGDLQNLKKLIEEDFQLINFRQKSTNFPLLYLAVRSGHYQIVQFLLAKGCRLQFSKDRSSPMHCAAYYGHKALITLLFNYGVPCKIKNVFEKLPVQEAATTQIQQLFKNAQKDTIQNMMQQLLDKKLLYSSINIQKDNKVIAKKIILKHYFRSFSNHVNAFHGTNVKALVSIAQHGLLKPGEKVGDSTLKVVQGHIKLGYKLGQIENWSSAVFVSPSIYYSAHPVYSKQFINEPDVWLPLVQVKVLKNSYTQHSHTLSKYLPKDCNQPVSVQFRVAMPDNHPTQHKIFRHQDTKAVTVVAILLLKKGFLEVNPNYVEVTSLLLNSVNQQEFREKQNLKPFSFK